MGSRTLSRIAVGTSWTQILDSEGFAIPMSDLAFAYGDTTPADGVHGIAVEQNRQISNPSGSTLWAKSAQSKAYVIPNVKE